MSSAYFAPPFCHLRPVWLWRASRRGEPAWGKKCCLGEKINTFLCRRSRIHPAPVLPYIHPSERWLFYYFFDESVYNNKIVEEDAQEEGHARERSMRDVVGVCCSLVAVQRPQLAWKGPRLATSGGGSHAPRRSTRRVWSRRGCSRREAPARAETPRPTGASAGAACPRRRIRNPKCIYGQWGGEHEPDQPLHSGLPHTLSAN